MVDSTKAHFAAEVYKSYLLCAARIIRSEGGVVTAYDGDRIMAVFIGASKNTCAVRCGLKISYVVQKIINPAIQQQYTTDFQLQQVVGIDTRQVARCSNWNSRVERSGLGGACR